MGESNNKRVKKIERNDTECKKSERSRASQGLFTVTGLGKGKLARKKKKKR